MQRALSEDVMFYHFRQTLWPIVLLLKIAIQTDDCYLVNIAAAMWTNNPSIVGSNINGWFLSTEDSNV